MDPYHYPAAAASRCRHLRGKAPAPAPPGMARKRGAKLRLTADSWTRDRQPRARRAGTRDHRRRDRDARTSADYSVLAWQMAFPPCQLIRCTVCRPTIQYSFRYFFIISKTKTKSQMQKSPLGRHSTPPPRRNLKANSISVLSVKIFLMRESIWY